MSENQAEAHNEWAEPQEQANKEQNGQFAHDEDDTDTEETEESILDMMYPNKEEDEEYPYDDND